MRFQVRVTLITGDVHRVAVEADNADAVRKRITGGQKPFEREWVEGTDGELIRMAAIVTVAVEDVGT